MPTLKPIRITYELEDVAGGTRVTEYTTVSPSFGPGLAFGMVMRMMGGKLKESRESLRSGLAVAAAAGTPPTDGEVREA